MKVKDIIALVKKDGWFLVKQKGSHQQYKHSVKKGRVTIPCHRLSDDVALSSLKSILKQAQIEIEKD